MFNRFSLLVLAFAQAACGAVVSAELDASSGDGSPVDAAPDAFADRNIATSRSLPSVRVATNAALGATSILRSGQRIFTATLWSGLNSHETATLYSFDRDGNDARRVADFFFRSQSTNALARSAIAVNADNVAVVVRRTVSQPATMSWGLATSVFVASTTDRDLRPTVGYAAGEQGVIDGVIEPRFLPSITSAGDAWLVLDMREDLRLRVSRIDRSGAVVGQRHFAVPFAITPGEELNRWAVIARGQEFVVATNNEAARLLVVNEQGITNVTERVQPISRTTSRPDLCAGEGDALEFAQSAENAATLWAIDVAPEQALRTVPLDASRALRMCASAGLWLRTQERTRSTSGDADVWDAAAQRARCSDELRRPGESVARTVDVTDTMAFATDVESNTIDLRPISLAQCLVAR